MYLCADRTTQIELIYACVFNWRERERELFFCVDFNKKNSLQLKVHDNWEKKKQRQYILWTDGIKYILKGSIFFRVLFEKVLSIHSYSPSEWQKEEEKTVVNTSVWPSNRRKKTRKFYTFDQIFFLFFVVVLFLC